MKEVPNKNMHKKPWFGFTEDKVFGEVMSNKEFCKHETHDL